MIVHPERPVRKHRCVPLVFVSLLLLVFALPNATHAQQGTPHPTFDLTDNGVVNDADATLTITGWSDAHQNGVCAPSGADLRDVDASGCVDVADVQKVLAAWGSVTAPNVRLPRAGSPPQSAGARFVVNNTGNGSDANPGDGVCATSGGVCTLRAAVQEANRRVGTDVVAFDIRKADGSCPTAPTVLQPGGVLTPPPELANLNLVTLDDIGKQGTIVDGYTQCGTAPNTDPIKGNAVIRIEIRGQKDGGTIGFFVVSPNNLVRGLAIYNHDSNIRLYGPSAYSNRIEGNFLGTNAAQTFIGTGSPTADNQGLYLHYKASRNIIGGATPDARNIISGNAGDGLYMAELTNENRVIGNYVGLKQDGITKLGNNSDGMDINIGCQNNFIGGINPGERNVISGNKEDGIEFSHTRPEDGRETFGLTVIGNYIGVSAYGGKLKDNQGKDLPFGNGEQGLTLEDQVRTYEAAYNVIANNGSNGIRLYYETTDVYIHDNRIGVGPNGEPLPNGVNPDPNAQMRGNNGIYALADSHKNRIVRNIIAYNKGYGVEISNSTHKQQGGEHETDYITVSQNSMYSNLAGGIRLDPSGTDYPNRGILPAKIAGANTQNVAGTACANCTVELFIADKLQLGGKGGQGLTYLASGVADVFGNFSIPVSGVNVDQLVTATVTDFDGNTSEFATNVKVVQSSVTPTATVTPTSTSTPTATPGSGTPTATPGSGTPTATPVIQPSVTPTPLSSPNIRVAVPLVTN